MWHSYASAAELIAGTHILITGGDQAVEVAAADSLSIELPDGAQRIALVLLCENDQLIIEVDGVRQVDLIRTQDDTGPFAGFRLSDGFSRQVWLVVQPTMS